MNHLRKIVQTTKPFFNARYMSRILIIDYDDVRGENPENKTDIIHINEEQYKKLDISWDDILVKSDENMTNVKEIIFQKHGMKKNLFVPFMSEYDYNHDNIDINAVKYYNLEDH